MALKIKDKYKARYVGFKGANGRKLGELDQAQLSTLAKIAQSSKDRLLLDLFDNEVPSAESLKKSNTAAKVAEIPKPASENTEANKPKPK